MVNGGSDRVFDGFRGFMGVWGVGGGGRGPGMEGIGVLMDFLGVSLINVGIR